MSKFVKGLLQEEIKDTFDGVESFVVCEITGIGGTDNNILRGELKEKGIKLRVVRNVLMRKALSNLGMASAASLFMTGQCVVAFGGDSVVDVAKELSNQAKKFNKIKFKGAFVDGQNLDADAAKELSKMPNRAELQGTVVMLAQSPGRTLAGAITGPAGIIAGCIKAHADKLEEAA